MRRSRFFIAQPLADGQACTVAGDLASYMHRVLRLQVGDEVIVFDGSGAQWPAAITALGRAQLTLRLGGAEHPDCESPLGVRLLQAVSRGDRMDFAVQKATELGVQEIRPVLSRHGVVRLDGSQAGRRMAHWQQVAVSACEQSGRTRPPQVTLPERLDRALDSLPDDGPRWLLCPDAAQLLGSDPAPAARTRMLTVLVGPEGGFADDELSLAAHHGFAARRLGPRILRTETAAAAVLAVLQARWGDLAG